MTEPEPTTVVRRRVVVRGRVQGVGFRLSCARRARALGLSGMVTNRPDGTVEAVFEGPEPQVASVVAWCRRGPAMAQVTAAEVHAEEPLGERGFCVV